MKNDDVLELNGTAFGASSHSNQIPRDYDLVDTASPLIDGEILEGFIIKKAEADDCAVVRWLWLLHNFIRLILNFRFCASSNPARGVSKICDSEDL